MKQSNNTGVELTIDEMKYEQSRFDSEPCKKSFLDIEDEYFDAAETEYFMQNQIRIFNAFRAPSKELEKMIADTKKSLKQIGAIK